MAFSVMDPGVTDEEYGVASPDDKLEVLEHRRNVNNNFKHVLSNLEYRNFEDLERSIRSVQENLEGIDKYLSTTIEPKYYAQRCSPDSFVAAKVFAVPELLEEILKNLELPDLMRCYAVNRCFKDVLERSHELQIKMFLRPAPEDSGRCCPFSCEDFKTTVWPGRFFVSIRRLADTKSTLPNMGSRWKRMLITQPPIYSMEFVMMCLKRNTACGFSNPEWPTELSVQSANGLTVGDLLETAKALLHRHRDCPLNNQQQTSERTFDQTAYFEYPAAPNPSQGTLRAVSTAGASL